MRTVLNCRGLHMHMRRSSPGSSETSPSHSIKYANSNPRHYFTLAPYVLGCSGAERLFRFLYPQTRTQTGSGPMRCRGANERTNESAQKRRINVYYAPRERFPGPSARSPDRCFICPGGIINTIAIADRPLIIVFIIKIFASKLTTTTTMTTSL